MTMRLPVIEDPQPLLIQELKSGLEQGSIVVNRHSGRVLGDVQKAEDSIAGIGSTLMFEYLEELDDIKVRPI